MESLHNVDVQSILIMDKHSMESLHNVDIQSIVILDNVIMSRQKCQSF